MESKDDIAIDIKDELQKITDGVYKDKNGKFLYEPDEEYQVKLCCCPKQSSSCDKPLLGWLAKSIVSFSVLAFCFIQLSRSKQSEFASSTISLILGTYLGGTVSNIQNTKTKKK